MEFDKDLLRWVLLIGAAPVWWPFLLALWRDFNRALREDGGLMGAPLSQREVEALRAERPEGGESLRSVPIVKPGERRTTRMRGPNPRTPRGAAAREKPGFGRSNRPRGR